jgi:protein SCO1/2
MKSASKLICLVALWLGGGEAMANAPTNIAEEITFGGASGNLVPVQSIFRDQDSELPLAALLGPYPTILVLGYSRCPQLCSEVMEGLVRSLKMTGLKLDKDYDVLSVSIDPDETPADASRRSARYIRQLAQGTEGWRSVTGSEINVKKLCASVGFKFARDPLSKQFAHAAGCVVLSPEGRIVQYFYGIDFSPSELRQSLLAAKSNQSRPTLRELLLLCFQYSPARNPLGARIVPILRALAVISVLGLGFVIAKALHNERIQTRPER